MDLKSLPDFDFAMLEIMFGDERPWLTGDTHDLTFGMLTGDRLCDFKFCVPNGDESGLNESVQGDVARRNFGVEAGDKARASRWLPPTTVVVGGAEIC